MAKTVLIELKTQDNATAKLKQAEQAVSKLGKTTKTSMDSSSFSIRQASSDLGSLGSRLRYLSLAYWCY